MSQKDDLLKKRFLSNMNRIHGLVHLLVRNEDLKPTSLFGTSNGVRADVFRSVVVFLHATFEVAIRDSLPRVIGGKGLYSRTDFDKALEKIGVPTALFRQLYPPLTAMTKRRKKIVHDADLDQDCEPRGWTIADDWQLTMWLMTVPAFFFLLRIQRGLSDVVEQEMYQRLRAAMTKHVEFGKQLWEFPSEPEDQKLQALKSIAATLQSIRATLHLDVSDFMSGDGEVPA